MDPENLQYQRSTVICPFVFTTPKVKFEPMCETFFTTKLFRVLLNIGFLKPSDLDICDIYDPKNDHFLQKQPAKSIFNQCAKYLIFSEVR